MVTIVLSIIAYILGPILVLTWAIKRFKSGQRPEFIELVAVVFAISMLALLIYSYSGDLSRDDKTEILAIEKEFITRYDFPVQAKFLQKPAVFVDARARAFDVKVYGIVTEEEQQKIVTIAKKIRRQIVSRPLVIYFMQEELWNEGEDGSRKPLRDKEISLRRVRVE